MANVNKGIPNVWFSADKHLYHEFMVKGRGDGDVPPRPMFATAEEMTEVIIQRHNEVVQRGDLVYELGDFAIKCPVEKARAAKRRMNGNFYLISGNHDGVAEKMAGEFVWSRDLARIRFRNFPEAPHIVLSHYAMLTWHGSHRGDWQLYGHSHAQLEAMKATVLPHLLSFDVGVDCWDFYPVSIEQVIEKMKSRIPAWEAWKKGAGREVGI